MTDDPHVRFYTGIPLELQDGLNVGTLCVIDNKPNKLTEEQQRILYFLSLQVTKLLERLKNLQLVLKQKALDDDLNAAATIQKSFSPESALHCNCLKIVSFWQPAHPIGGDVFNVIKAKDKTILYMIDVSGHDVPSALVTMSVSQFFHQNINSPILLSPKDMLKALNEEYPFNDLRDFLRFFILLLILTQGASNIVRLAILQQSFLEKVVNHSFLICRDP